MKNNGKPVATAKPRAPRNKTLELCPAEEKALVRECLVLKAKVSREFALNRVILQDAMQALDFLPAECADLMIADPPYNLTKNFGSKVFREMESADYRKWLDKWLGKTVRVLKPNASVYICADWRTSVDVFEAASKYFTARNRITWEREKGRSCADNWKNCLEDIWFFTKGKDYTFNLDAVKVERRVLAPYKDSAGNPKDWKDCGEQKTRLTAASNIWTDISIPFWSMAENTNHPTQKPEKLIAKLILASSNQGDVVLDPFLGSGTTAVVAKKLKRHFIGIEREKEYAALANARLARADKDPAIQGFEGGVFKARNN